MKRALVCGASGFIAGHLIRKLRREAYWVRGVDIRDLPPDREVDSFVRVDLRHAGACHTALAGGFDEVYQLAANVGGMGYTHVEECEIMHDNALININMIHAAAEMEIPRYFFSSSACVYRDMGLDEPMITEEEAYPAHPDNEYGWEKLYAERIALTYARRYPIQVRIARFDSVFGPDAPWRGGREKVLPAFCRKAIEAEDGGDFEIWGNGTAVRTEIYVTDTVEGVYALMQSDLEGPTNIGSDVRHSVNEFADMAIELSGKKLTKKHIDGPVGVRARNFGTERIRSLGWGPQVPLEVGLKRLYNWIEGEMGRAS